MPQIRIIAATCCILFFIVSYSQTQPGEKYDCHFINLVKTEVARVKVPFGSITVCDVRPDDSKAGYYYPGEKDNGVRIICFKGGITNEVLSFFNSRLQLNKDSKLSAVACIKKLWFGTYDTTNVKENKLTLRTRKLMLKMEIYLKDENCYYPLYRFDSTLNFDDLQSGDPSYVLGIALQKSLRKLANGGYTDYQKLRCISTCQVDSFNNVCNRFAVLNEKVAQKGVYLTLAQFQNNSPAYTEFNLQFNRSEDIITIKGEDGEDVAVNAWAVSDGKKMYIRMGKNYFRLIKSGHNYDFYGFDTFFERPVINPYSTAFIIALLNLAITKVNRPKPFQLNLETGEVY